jgi:hypothetical protein
MSEENMTGLVCGLRPTPAPSLLDALRGKVCNLTRIHVEHDLTLASIGVLIVTVAASFSSIVLPVKSLTKIVFRAMGFLSLTLEESLELAKKLG